MFEANPICIPSGTNKFYAREVPVVAKFQEEDLQGDEAAEAKHKRYSLSPSLYLTFSHTQTQSQSHHAVDEMTAAAT